MEKNYVLDHDWGSYDTEDTVNKIMLRNIDDFIIYFDREINQLYIAEEIGKYRFEFQDDTIIEFVPEVIRR